MILAAPNIEQKNMRTRTICPEGRRQVRKHKHNKADYQTNLLLDRKKDGQQSKQYSPKLTL